MSRIVLARKAPALAFRTLAIELDHFVARRADDI